MADDQNDVGAQEGDTGATGRAPRPTRPADTEFDELDASFADGPEPEPRTPAFFEEEPEPEPVRRAPVEDFGFDEIARDDEPARGRSRVRPGRRAGASSRSRGRGSRPAGGRSRAAAGGRGGGGRGGRPAAPASPLQSPGVRIAIGVAVAALIIIVVYLVIQDYRRGALVDSYKTYVNSASQIADESSTQGQQLLTILQNRQNKNATALQQDVRALATQAVTLSNRAEDLDPPDALGDAQRDLETVLRYRANGLTALADGLPVIIRSTNQRSAAQNIAASMKRLVASDVIYRDSFADVVAAKVRDEEISGLEVATDAIFLKGANDRYATEAGARTLLPALKSTGGQGSTSGSGSLRGTSLVGVVATPSNTTLKEESVSTIPASSSLEWVVTISNGGDFAEEGITVTATLRYPGQAEPADTQEVTLDAIASKEEGSVTIPGPSADAWQPGVEGSLEISVQPVDGETRTDNNSAEYPVTITTS